MRDLIQILCLAFCIATGSTSEAAEHEGRAPAKVSLTLIPPSPVTDQITLDIRAAVRNPGETAQTVELAVYLDKELPATLLHREQVLVGAYSAKGIAFRWATKNLKGKHRVLLIARSGGKTFRASQPLVVLPSDVRSAHRLAGAWVDLYHHDEAEGKPFNAELAQMTAVQWRELVRAMHAADQNILVITMMFHNFVHRGQHHMETDGYHGRAYYPSQLYPGRMPIATQDPLEIILSEADRLGMQVLPGVGLYAFFDFSPSSLTWHKQVAAELWARYGHHPSFYGWYVSEEQDGGLGSVEERREIVDFFRQFTPYVRGLAPDKPVMLAINSFHFRGAEDTYRQLLPHLDILCPFGFHRMPAADLTGEQAAALMQSLCDEAHTHLWLDLESFVFGNNSELHPRPIEGLVRELTRFGGFEKTLHYQFPGLMSSPAMSRQPGGPGSVKLYLDYKKHLQTTTTPAHPVE